MTDKPILDRLLSVINELTNGNKKKFAEMLGVSPVHIDGWINKGYAPRADHLANIQEKLGINLNWLLTGQGERYIKPAHLSYGEPSLTEEERGYIKKLIQIFKTKQEKIVIAIKQNIEAFLDTPNKERVKKNMAKE